MTGIMGTSEIADIVNRFKPVNIEEMPVRVADGTAFDHPSLPGSVQQVKLRNGRTVEREITIADMNHGKYSYAYLDAPTLERYNGSYRVVTKDCEAAKFEGGHIPDKYFNAQGVIYNNGTLYCYCSWAYHEDMTRLSEDSASLSLAALAPRRLGAEKNEHGKTIAAVNSTKLNSRHLAE